MIQEKTFEINGQRYRIQQLGAREGRRVWLKLLKVLSGPLKAASEAEGGVTEMLLVKALASLFDAVDDEMFDELCEVFGKKTQVYVKESDKWPELTGVVFDTHFARNYVAMMQWLGECVVFNFGSFLGEASIGDAIAQLRKVASKSLSPTGTTGTPSAS